MELVFERCHSNNHREKQFVESPQPVLQILSFDVFTSSIVTKNKI